MELEGRDGGLKVGCCMCCGADKLEGEDGEGITRTANVPMIKALEPQCRHRSLPACFS